LQFFGYVVVISIIAHTQIIARKVPIVKLRLSK
jgi:hypothetical protein